jgi:hypothetical protein
MRIFSSPSYKPPFDFPSVLSPSKLTLYSERRKDMRLYPRAHENRVPTSHPSFRGTRKAFIKAAATNFILLQLLFLSLFCYIYGAIFEQAPRTHQLQVIYVDYDGGLVGASIRDAYKSLQGNGFPTLFEHPPSEFPAPEDLRKEVCNTRYWAALYTSPGASNRLQTALTSHSTAYDKADVLSYIWNEARYSAVIDSSISANLQTLSSTARIRYAADNWTDTLDSLNTATISVLTNPWQLTSINIQPTTQGSRLIYNTLVIILVLIQEFFYLGTLNTLYETFKIYTRIDPHKIIFFRNLISGIYTLIGSLCTTGAIWAFRSGWNVNSNQFALTWAILWLFAHVNFLTLDVFTVWLPPPYIPMALITWAAFNVTSVLIPYALSPAFYRWSYVIPAHETYQVLVDIWSGGCNPQLHYALPVLFALELCGLFFSGLGVHRRCHYAVIKEEMEQQAFKLRVDRAAALEQQRDERLRKEQSVAPISAPYSDIHPTELEEERDQNDRREIENVIGKEDVELQKMRRKIGRDLQLGPSFGFNFGCHEPSKKE